MKQVRLSQQQLRPLFADFANHDGLARKLMASDGHTKGTVERTLH